MNTTPKLIGEPLYLYHEDGNDYQYSWVNPAAIHPSNPVLRLEAQDKSGCICIAYLSVKNPRAIQHMSPTDTDDFVGTVCDELFSFFADADGWVEDIMYRLADAYNDNSLYYLFNIEETLPLETV
ncbi:hypothetical protein [Polynucleobacter sp. es-MAR-4]|uniref:hypothetical protein n=1 Tax=Polynucleobacter sp. es-MAR-4 TaxID=1855655 RepID=UPI001C0D3675|nr:hypothetical protein [Polynucleobacter sp. es-MAR-4]MBU3637356.1 hypothetical protein [Polynucleobacter sp. es-MAR-4]